MKKAPIPENDKERLAVLRELGILDTAPEERFDAITREASEYFNVPISTVTLVDNDREWHKSHLGIQGQQGPRDQSFCGHALLANSIFIINDTKKDPNFADNPYVINPPYIRFYAGIALREKTTNLPIGAFCIKDTKPREFLVEDVAKLISFSQRAENELNKKM